MDHLIRLDDDDQWWGAMESFKIGGCKEPAAKEYPPLPPCNDLDEEFDGGDVDEDLGGDKEAVPLKQSVLDPVHIDHHLNKVFRFNFA